MLSDFFSVKPPFNVDTMWCLRPVYFISLLSSFCFMICFQRLGFQRPLSCPQNMQATLKREDKILLTCSRTQNMLQIQLQGLFAICQTVGVKCYKQHYTNFTGLNILVPSGERFPWSPTVLRTGGPTFILPMGISICNQAVKKTMKEIKGSQNFRIFILFSDGMTMCNK